MEIWFLIKKLNFFQAVAMSWLLYSYTTWTLMRCFEKKLDGNYKRMLYVILTKSWKQHPTKQQLYGHLTFFIETIQVKWMNHVGHCWRSKDKLISNLLLWNPKHGHTSGRWLEKIYVHQWYANTQLSLEDLLGVKNDRELIDKWKRMKGLHACCMTWWWWWWYIYIYITEIFRK